MMATFLQRAVGVALAVASLTAATPVPALLARQTNGSAPDLSACPGYKASNVKTTGSGITADLSLAGTACNAYSDDLDDLTLTVEYQSGRAIHDLCVGADQLC